MPSALLIDAGQSASRARLARGGAVVDGPGLPRRGRDYGVLRPLIDGTVDVVAAGLTGFDGDAAAVARALGVRVIATNDAVTSYLGALGAVPGAVVVAGTGVMALACGEDGRWARADGYGSLLGDDGGGYWIGRRGLALALRARDGRRGGSEALLARAVARFGARDPAAGSDAPAGAAGIAAAGRAARAHPAGIVPAIYDAPDPVAAIASFAVDVAEAARAGDAAAAAIWAEAADELAQTALAAARAVGVEGPFAYAGGLFAAGPLLLDPLRAALPGVQAPAGDALDGAARLLDRPPLFTDLIVEAGAP